MIMLLISRSCKIFLQSQVTIPISEQCTTRNSTAYIIWQCKCWRLKLSLPFGCDIASMLGIILTEQLDLLTHFCVFFLSLELWFLMKFEVKFKSSIGWCLEIKKYLNRHKTLFQGLKDVYTTLATSCRRRMDVETTSCVYWDLKHADLTVILKDLNLAFLEVVKAKRLFLLR